MKYIKFAILTASAALLTSCGAVYEDLDPCPKGADVTLVYDYNMLKSDVFKTAAHCPTLHVYDAEGNYVDSHAHGNNQTLSLDLPAGRYHVIAYDGMDCADASFVYGPELLGNHHYSKATTVLKTNSRAGSESSAMLHDHYQAAGDITVEEDSPSREGLTLQMVKNTNNLRVVLQHVDGSDITASMFDFYVTADNAVMGHDNKVVKQGEDVTYRPWVTGEVASGMLIVEQGKDPKQVQNAYAEISLGRIMADDSPVLHIDIVDENGGTNDPVLALNLVEYIEMIKSRAFADMSTQEYLDRQDQYSMVFLIDPTTHRWVGLQIKVNDWDVVLNDWDL